LASASPLFTVFTATYNRAHTLPRVFDSLCAQTLRDFEWIIVDDGSVDRTPLLIDAWQRSGQFPIRCFRQENSGKHIAYNRALQEARGKYMMTLDSDDACVPRALERLAHHWATIPADRYHEFSSVSGLCQDQDGRIVGDRFPSDPFDTNLRDCYFRYKLRGERAGAARIEVLRQYPFPVIENTRFIPEGAIWFEIARTYKIRFVNEIFRTYYMDDQAAGPTLSKSSRVGANAAGRLYYYQSLLRRDMKYFLFSPMTFVKAAAMLPVVANEAGEGIVNSIASLGLAAKMLVLASTPISFLLWARERCAITLTSKRH
jgi:glycosyltransferase involved in cell wall biosynthesis